MMAHNFDRQESVTDEDLFGDGRVQDEAKGQTDEAQSHLLPDFGLLGISFTSDKTKVSPVDKGEENEKGCDKSENNTCLNYKSEGSAEFKATFRSKGSVSLVEGKRKRFSHRSDVEVFYDDGIYETPEPNQVHVVRKSNSLPDLIISSSSSASDGKSSNPDVTLSYGSLPSTGDLEVKKNTKEAFEGKSSCRTKHKGTSVSFQKAGDTIAEIADEGFIEQSKDENVFDEPNIDKTATCDKTADRKRELYSKSSGYLTGSESRDKSKGSVHSQISTTANSEASSELWTSNEIANEKLVDNDVIFGNFPNMSGFTKSFGSNSRVETGGSEITITSGQSTKSQNPGEVELGTTVENAEVMKDPSLTFKRLKTESYSDDDSTINPNERKGNFPKLEVFHDSSVMMGQSTLNQINMEDDEKIRRNVQRLNNGSLSQGSLMPSQDPRSSITDCSAYRINQRQLLEARLTAGDDFSFILKQMQGSESSTPSPSPADPSRVVSPGQKFTCNCIQRASPCCKKDCTDKACTKLALINKALEKVIFTEDSEYELVKQYCQALLNHHQDCEELWCKVKYCQDIGSWNVGENDIQGVLDCIQTSMKAPKLTILASNNYKYHKVRDINSYHKKDVIDSLIPISSLGTFGSALLCVDKSQHLCVVKTYALFDYRHQISLYGRLSEKHHYIVDQLWILEHENVIQICSDFMSGGSLFDYIQALGPLTWQAAMTYIQQMLSALTFLHKNGIVYLNWNSGNMMFSDTAYKRVKINNFSLSCPLGIEFDLGAVKQCLLPNIIPPELLQENGTAQCQSDIWGVGCMVYELLMGETVWSNLRHNSREYIHKNIYSGKVPELPPNLTEDQTNVFKSCWQLHPQERFTTEKLYDYITRNLQTHRETS